MKQLIWMILLLTAVYLANNFESSKEIAEARPNILLIVLDDVGYSDLGPYGSEINTPNISRKSVKNSTRRISVKEFFFSVENLFCHFAMIIICSI